MTSPSNDAASMQINSVEEHVETPPLAFTVQFDAQPSEARKLKIQDKLSSFALKHRRNPSLPDFKAVKTAQSSQETTETKPSVLHRPKQKTAGYHSEGYFSSDQDEDSVKLWNRNRNMPRPKISPVTEDRGFVPQVNGHKNLSTSKVKKATTLRRSSMNDIDLNEMLKPKLNATFTVENERPPDCDKSDTVSEAGTYTVEKEEDTEEIRESRKTLTPENHKWINEWVKKVAEESSNCPPKETIPMSSESSSASASKIPSPVNTMPKIREAVVTRRAHNKVNGTHRRSASLSTKDLAENRKSDSSLETESYLAATESAMVALQSRMRQNLKLNLAGPVNAVKKDGGRKERLHPPSTASDTDTNSDNDAKNFKKPQGGPFTSAKLNRAYSLRTNGGPEATDNKKLSMGMTVKPVMASEKRRSPAPASIASKPKTSATTPFARTDVGRFSMRSVASIPKAANPNTSGVAKTSVNSKKPGGAGSRSNSTLSSREMEFQNWKRRKSFDPMKAAAEGRKKEAAKKMAVTQSMSHSMISSSQSQVMTQSVNLGTTVQPRSGNAVFRSASFHTSHMLSGGLDVEDDLSYDEPEDDGPVSPPALPPNSPNRGDVGRLAGLHGRRGASESRGSLNSAGGASEVHSSPSRRARAEFIDNLLVSAIAEISIGLKIKSSDILRKLDASIEEDERVTRMREELAVSDSQRGSSNSSPAHRAQNTRDFPAILKNLKTIENVMQVLDDVLFGDTSPED